MALLQRYGFYSCIALIIMLSLSVLGAKKYTPKKSPCGDDKQACKDLNNGCQCYCAYKPGLRDKIDDDAPVFLKKDPKKINCYCKLRDIEKHYE